MDVSIYVLLQVRSKEVSRQISAGYYAVTAVEIFRYVIHMRKYITHIPTYVEVTSRLSLYLPRSVDNNIITIDSKLSNIYISLSCSNDLTRLKVTIL